MRSQLKHLRRRTSRYLRVDRLRARHIPILPRPREPLLHAAEAGAGTAAARPAVVTSNAALLATHILRDGEIVLMVLKPSFWFIIFNTAAFAAVSALACVALALLDHRMHDSVYTELCLFLIAGRLMWATLQWMGRLYILTDLRVLRVSGVFTVDVFDCPLRKVVRTRLISAIRERVVAVGSIEIIPKDEEMPTAIWQTIRKPIETHERLVAAINRAKQSGLAGE